MKRLSIPLILATLAMAACSDSDYGAAPPAPPPPPPSNFAITSGNAMTVASATWNAANGSADLADLFDKSAGSVASNPGNLNKAGDIATAPGVGAGNVQGIPIPATTVDCQVIGTVTISGSIADPITPTLTADDYFVSDFSNCDEGAGEILNGLLRMTVDAFSGDQASGVYSLTATFDLTDLQVNTDLDVVTSTGSVTVAFDYTVLNVVTASISGVWLTVDSNTGSTTLSEFQTVYTIDSSGQLPTFTLNTSGMLDSSALPGTVTYSTPVDLQGFEADFPSSGEFLITALDSSLRIIALDNVNVRIEIDSNGDGVVDETMDTTWALLTS